MHKLLNSGLSSDWHDPWKIGRMFDRNVGMAKSCLMALPGRANDGHWAQQYEFVQSSADFFQMT
ncbi:hypothetical protein DPV78_004685 [Talaromyces pinophilus]|nr:hypothetical protein DPV78_004685 [Talaromyces pinophilus]